MKNNVDIRLKSIVASQSGDDRIDLNAKGGMMIKDGTVYLSYKENADIGFNDNVLIKVKNRSAEIKRSGKNASQFLIDTGKRNLCSYSLPYGTAVIGITGNKVEVKKNKDVTEIYICYEIDVNSELVSKNQLFINVKERAN